MIHTQEFNRFLSSCRDPICLVTEMRQHSCVVNEDDNIVPEETHNFITNSMKTLNINIPNFQEKVMEHIKNLINLIECKKEQKKLISSGLLKIL